MCRGTCTCIFSVFTLLCFHSHPLAHSLSPCLPLSLPSPRLAAVNLGLLYWIYMWGAYVENYNVNKWGVFFGISTAQDVLITEFLKTFLLTVGSLVSARPQLRTIRRIINDIAMQVDDGYELCGLVVWTRLVATAATATATATAAAAAAAARVPATGNDHLSIHCRGPATPTRYTHRHFPCVASHFTHLPSINPAHPHVAAAARGRGRLGRSVRGAAPVALVPRGAPVRAHRPAGLRHPPVRGGDG